MMSKHCVEGGSFQFEKMSKSQVKISSSSNLKIEKSKTVQSNVRSALDEGHKLNVSRCQQEKPAETCWSHRVRQRKCQAGRARIWKIVHPPGPKCDCNHRNGFTLDRNLLSRSDHRNYLAQPKKAISGPCARWIWKKIPTPSLHVRELAEPKPAQLLETFQSHLSHLSIVQAENFLNKLYKKDYQTPQEAVSIMRASECRMKKFAEKKKMRSACRNKMKQNCGSVEDMLDCFKPFFTNCEQFSLSEESTKVSEVVLSQICQLMKIKVPERSSCCLVDQILCKIADKVAWWMLNFVEKSGFRNIDANSYDQSECAELFRKKCFPIEDFYPHNEPVDSHEESDQEETRKEESEEAMSGSSEKKLSFLRKSQIKLNPNDCQDLFAKLADHHKRKAEKAEKTAKIAKEKTAKAREEKAKKAKAKRRATGRSKGFKGSKKTGKKGGVNGESEDEFDCYGDVDKKPQWEVEWIDRLK